MLITNNTLIPCASPSGRVLPMFRYRSSLRDACGAFLPPLAYAVAFRHRCALRFQHLATIAACRRDVRKGKAGAALIRQSRQADEEAPSAETVAPLALVIFGSQFSFASPLQTSVAVEIRPNRMQARERRRVTPGKRFSRGIHKGRLIKRRRPLQSFRLDNRNSAWCSSTARALQAGRISTTTDGETHAKRKFTKNHQNPRRPGCSSPDSWGGDALADRRADSGRKSRRDERC